MIRFPCGSAGKESVCNVGDLGLIPGLGRSPGEGKGCPLQYSGLKNSMDCTAWGCEESDRTKQLTFTSLHVCIEYLWTPNRLLAAKGHLRTQLCIKGTCARVGEAPVVSVCTYRVLELEKSLWLFCSTSVSSPGLHWGMSGVVSRDQLESFFDQATPHCSCLPSKLTSPL